jgi:hypothetical protein
MIETQLAKISTAILVNESEPSGNNPSAAATQWTRKSLVRRTKNVEPFSKGKMVCQNIYICKDK